MYMLNVVITTSNTPQRIIAPAVTPDSMHPFQGILPQNNGSNIIYLGDNGVSPTTSLSFYPLSSGGSMQNILSYGSVLEDFYVYGTAGDRMNFMVFP